MFNKIKHLKDLRSQAKTLEKSLAGESITIDKHGISLTMDGNQKVTALKIDPQTSLSQVEKLLPEILEEANNKVRRVMAQKLQAMGGLDNFPGFNG